MPRHDNPDVSQSIVNYVTSVVLAGRIWNLGKTRPLNRFEQEGLKMWLNSSLAWGRLVRRHWGW